jgi:hypothetical protein
VTWSFATFNVSLPVRLQYAHDLVGGEPSVCHDLKQLVDSLFAAVRVSAA